MIRKYELKLNDEIIPVIVDGPNEGKLTVTFNGNEFIVTITDADRDRGVFHITVSNRELTLHVTPQPDSKGYKVTLNQRDYTALLTPVSTPVAKSTKPTTVSTPDRTSPEATVKATVEPGAVVAPLPGRVIEVRVKEGAAVQAGDVIVVLEAMKMANEIRAAQAGVVQQVHVQSGNAVEKGQALVTIG